jgi:hypothetical protein
MRVEQSAVAYIRHGPAERNTDADLVAPKQSPCSEAEQLDELAAPENTALPANEVSIHSPYSGVSHGFSGWHPPYCAPPGHITKEAPPMTLGHHLKTGI